jgi:hypothetical protein
MALMMSALTTNFYPTLAQVLPVLMLALIWDSAYLMRLRRQRRPLRRDDPAGVFFWTKPRVRAYILIVAGETIVCLAVTMLVLAGIIPNSPGLRITLCAGLILLLATLGVRISVDVIRATSTTAQPPESGEQLPIPADSRPASSQDPPGGAPASYQDGGTSP